MHHGSWWDFQVKDSYDYESLEPKIHQYSWLITAKLQSQLDRSFLDNDANVLRLPGAMCFFLRSFWLSLCHKIEAIDLTEGNIMSARCKSVSFWFVSWPRGRNPDDNHQRFFILTIFALDKKGARSRTPSSTNVSTLESGETYLQSVKLGTGTAAWPKNKDTSTAVGLQHADDSIDNTSSKITKQESIAADFENGTYMANKNLIKF